MSLTDEEVKEWRAFFKTQGYTLTKFDAEGNRKRARERYKRAQENGICLDCSAPSTNGDFCQRHYEGRLKQQKRYRDKVREIGDDSSKSVS